MKAHQRIKSLSNNFSVKYLLSVLAVLCFSVLGITQTNHPDYHDGKLYVKFKNEIQVEFSSLEELNSNTGNSELIEILQQFQVSSFDQSFPSLKTEVFKRTFTLEFSDFNDAIDLIESLESISLIEYAERIPIMRTEYVPNDPLQSSQFAPALISAFGAYDIHQGGNAVVAIVDDAVFINHEDLQPNIWVNPGEIPNNGIDDDGNGYVDDVNGYDAVDGDNNPSPPSNASNGFFTHGTHCAGIAGAATDNGKGVVSIGFNNKIMPVKTKRDSNTDPSSLDNTGAGVAYAIAAGADVISMSYGGTGFSQTSQNLFDEAYANGIVCLSSAGNDNSSSSSYYPANYNHVISVASTTGSDTKSSFSNYGTWVDISAPGSSIYSTLAGSTSSYGDQSGTSMSCPMAAGLIGLMKSYAPTSTVDQLEQCLLSSADDIDAQNPSYIGQLGAGRINGQAALLCVTPIQPPSVAFTSNNEDILCPGSYVQFENLSQYISNLPVSYEWTFAGGIPSTSQLANPTVLYNTSGTYDVKLKVVSPYGEDSTILVNQVQVDGVNGLEEFFLEDFESGDFATNGWTVNNPDNSRGWDVDQAAGDNNGSYGAYMRMRSYLPRGSRDELISPAFDLSSSSNVRMTADYAYTNFLGRIDSLYIKVSTDGGSTWTTEAAFGENGFGNFVTHPSQNSSFIPSFGDWCYDNAATNCIDIDLSSYDGSANVLIMFETVNDNGNNLWLDNIRLTRSCSAVPSLQAEFAASAEAGCSTMTVDYTDQSLGGATSWVWTFPGGTPATSTLQNPTVTYATPGDYDATLVVSDGTGSSTLTKTEIVSVRPSGSTSAGFTSSNTGFDFVFTNTSAGATQNAWDFGDGNLSSLSDPAYTYPNPGTYTVTLTAVGDCGFDVMTMVVTTPPVAEFDQDITFGCAPISVNFSDQSLGSVVSRNWTFAGGVPATSTAANPSVTFASPGGHLVTLEVTNASGTSTTNRFILGEDLPTADFSFTVNGTVVSFNNAGSSTGPSVTYDWDLGDGTMTSTNTNIIHAYPDVTATYPVTITVTNSCGSTSYTDNVTITGSVGVSTLPEGQSIDLAPSLTTDRVTLYAVGFEPQNAQVQIIDRLGRTLYTDVWQQGNQHTISAQSLATGMYYIQIQTEQGIVTESFMKIE